MSDQDGKKNVLYDYPSADVFIDAALAVNSADPTTFKIPPETKRRFANDFFLDIGEVAALAYLAEIEAEEIKEQNELLAIELTARQLG